MKPDATPPTAARLRGLFEARGGYLTSREARDHGIHAEQLARLVALGRAERVQRGVYRLLGDATPFGAAEELLELQLRVPYARPCLVSALHLHGLTTTRPAALQFAIPRHRAFPWLAEPRVEVFYFQPQAYAYGTFELAVAGRRLTTYTAEKTLADLLRYAPKLGREVYLEGLKNYLRGRPHRAGRALIEAARAMRVEAPLRRDLEVLAHDQAH
ncbi:MAG TPA: type IV toxin-antitoxin system AbiEi family antitoxin domain-containing protein [Deinococcales bacterium]|nr:type IV toxin-antitoxin system AbiEi family antitoxin domain-containing protein [Deinococcales bacterium]